VAHRTGSDRPSRCPIRARRVWLAIATLTVAPSVVLGQVTSPAAPQPAPVAFEEPLVTGAALVHDNDNWPHPGNTLRDDNYSAGYAVRFSGRWVTRSGLSTPLEGLDWLTRVNRGHHRGARQFHAAELVGLVYTPDVIHTAAVQTDDRPYASLVAVTVSRTSVGGAALDRAWWSQLSIGMLGLEAPGDLQKLTHRTRRWMTGNAVPVDPLGWANQISAGGEPTALYRVGYQRRLAGDGGIGRRKHWQVVSDVEGAVGYQTTAAASLSARLGAFTAEFWQSPRGVASAAVAPPDTPAPGVRRWDLFAFAVLRPRVVLYDALLQGQFRASVHTVTPRRLLGEWEGGVGAAMPLNGWHVQAVMQLAQGRTADYVGAKARNYTWGTVGLFVSRSADRLAGRR
jgi:hypothetical protein